MKDLRTEAFHMAGLRVVEVEHDPRVTYAHEPIALPFPAPADFERWLNGISNADMTTYLETGAVPERHPAEFCFKCGGEKDGNGDCARYC